MDRFLAGATVHDCTLVRLPVDSKPLLVASSNAVDSPVTATAVAADPPEAITVVSILDDPPASSPALLVPVCKLVDSPSIGVDKLAVVLPVAIAASEDSLVQSVELLVDG